MAGGEDMVQFTGSVPSAGSYPAAAYRFHPGVLPSQTGADPYPYVLASPWMQLGDMSIPRNYPNIVPLNRIGFLSNCSSAPFHQGSGGLVIGGRPAYTEGNEIWDFLNAGDLGWSCALAPAAVPSSYPHPYTDHAGVPAPGGLTLPFVLFDPVNQTADPNTLPELDLESYPKAHQISTGEIVIAGDRDKISSPINSPSLTWSIRPHYSSAGVQTRWELYRSGLATADRQWGTGVLMHMRDSFGVFNDRLFALGGGTTGATPTTLDTVDEFILGTIGAQNGTWTPKTSMNHARWQLNAVTLPTGQLFLHGGEGPHALGGGPVYTPEIYEPGRSWVLPTAIPNLSYDVAEHPVQIPRGQHHVAVLLPDARVFIAGGDWQGDPLVPNSKHNGAIYSPWYLDLGFRPQILRSAASATFNLIGSSANKFELKVRVGVENTVERVVLIHPGAVTHHFDNDQRYIELAFSVVAGDPPPPPPPPPGTLPPVFRYDVLDVTCPVETLGPAGWYMLFAVEKRASDNALAPSVAVFIDIQ